MSENPKDLKYSAEHEWIRIEGKTGVAGITYFAQDQLGDVVFVELPEVGRVLKAGEQFGVVESVKTVSDLYSPANGKVVAVNEKLANSPEVVNSDPYGEGWMVKIEVDSLDPGLIDADAYDQHTAGGGH